MMLISASSSPSSSTSTSTTAKQGHQERDLVIIGSGPAGCTAAIYTARAILRPLVIAGYQSGGQLMLTSDVENFPGYREAIAGPTLMDDLTTQAERFGAEFWRTDCKSVDFSCYPFKVQTHNCTISARAVILSTGAEALWLGADREDEFKGKGISTCATCDGYLFREKDVCVIGGGDSAMEEASFLTRFARSVTVIHRRNSFRASKVMLQRAIENSKIRMKTDVQVVNWEGKDGVLSGVKLKSNVDGTEEQVKSISSILAFSVLKRIAIKPPPIISCR
jgi:thioredoxin reductase (NADPH)